jgi:hypothetical protein
MMGAFFLFISLFAVAVILFEAIGYAAYKATDNTNFLPKEKSKGGRKA